MKEDLKKYSRKNFTVGDKAPDIATLTLACQLRIADSLETISKDKERLEAGLKYNKSRAHRLALENDLLRRQLAGTKGVVTKLKKKIKGMENEPSN